MRYLVAVSILLATAWSMDSMALDLQMKFNVKNLGDSGNPEKSVAWNPATQEAIVRLGLVPTYLDPSLADAVVNFATAREVQVIPLEFPELIEGCEQVSQWQFEYRPGLPDYLMYVTLKGPNCQMLASGLELYRTRFRFLGVSTQSDPVDVAVEISR